MKNIFIIFFLFSNLLLIGGCNSDITSSEINEALGYLPLEEGNQWEFYFQGNDTLSSNWTIITSIIINGKKYFLLSHDENLTVLDTLRIDNDIVFLRLNGIDKKWIDFNTSNNSSYQFGELNVFVSTNLEIQTKAGRFKNCISFLFDNPTWADEEISYVFAKGIGFVKIQTAWVGLLLKSYKVK